MHALHHIIIIFASDKAVVFTSSNSSTEGVTPTNVPIPSPGDQTSLDTSSQQDIVNNVQYNVTMIAVNAIGASQPSSPILFIRGMYVYAYVCISLLWGLQVLSQKLTSHVQVPCESLSMVKVIKS